MMKLSLVLVASLAVSVSAFTSSRSLRPTVVVSSPSPTRFGRTAFVVPPTDRSSSLSLSSSSSSSSSSDVVVIDPDFKAAAVFTALGTAIIVGNHALLGYVVGGFSALLGVLFGVQGTRVRFVFDETSFEVRQGGSTDAEDLRSSGENMVVGGANRWTYDSFVNYDFFPSLDLPILVYFKETQTPKDKWNEGPGQLDEVGGGQIHFFPCICNAQQINDEFAKRGCAKVPDDS